MSHTCSLTNVAYCGGEHEACGPGDWCGGHSVRTCFEDAMWRLEGPDSLQYACEDHHAVIAGRMRSGKATRL